MIQPPPRSTVFPSTNLFRSHSLWLELSRFSMGERALTAGPLSRCFIPKTGERAGRQSRSEEHTLNSSHSQISYAVFCLKKKNKRHHTRITLVVGHYCISLCV